MDVTITGRNVGITDRFRTYVEQKSDKLDVLADRALAFEVRISRHHEKSGSSQGEDRVELTLIGPGPLVRAESAASDKYAAFDLAFARMSERLRRARDRKKVHRGRHRPTSVAEASGSAFDGMGVVPADAKLIEDVATGTISVVDEAAREDAEEVYSPVVIREKVFEAAPMTVDDALYHMELVGHDFYLFVDADTHRPSVVYRRKGWDYGVIGLDGTDSTAAADAQDRRTEPASAIA
ncbi:ribosome hibernation-promoting factor, HPF/YfiA family [Curtobacterium sp. VKM Ac-2922]|uniref:ribosome hibernation-promoting factor, HPF/YfiA family n=1 Tax=Curtobacterium sp. VKM Ac-2922 TaxID=2929475 RepID=UPI001FB55B46|nr:ribosome-associated translation inhibitor RaiA [Curtobacterium sp. VKM Ac-2922]MCJ1713328.1 ribosome-associated translation inhibitor RaiA [Curtobacterium sp. VKM Ac-2922]